MMNTIRTYLAATALLAALLLSGSCKEKEPVQEARGKIAVSIATGNIVKYVNT